MLHNPIQQVIMTRRLIIIAEDGTPANFLNGVERDYLSLIQFFESKEGGAYTGKEMFLFHNCCSIAILQSAIQLDITGEGIDKLIVVFCGHGYGLPSGDFAICFNNGHQLLYSEVMKMCVTIPTLFIADSCRVVLSNYQNNPPSIGNKFNAITSCTHSEFSYETDEGGIYTKDLIKASKLRYKQNHSPIAISHIHHLAKIWTYLRTNKLQHAQIGGWHIDYFFY